MLPVVASVQLIVVMPFATCTCLTGAGGAGVGVEVGADCSTAPRWESGAAAAAASGRATDWGAMDLSVLPAFAATFAPVVTPAPKVAIVGSVNVTVSPGTTS